MSKAALLTIIIPAMLGMQACNRASNQDNMVEVDTGTSAINDTAPKLNIAVEKGDAQFIINAAGGSLEEVAMGKLAERNGTDLRIKNFGKMMVVNHAKLTNLLLALAKEKKIAIPAGEDPDTQKVITGLSQKTGSDFDKAYIKSMINNHEKDIDAFEAASKNCQDPDIKAFAKKTLPILRTHLDAINAIKGGMN